MKILILFLMIFLHIVDDFYLQGVLAKMKQRRWWKENAPLKMYRNDYKAALLVHGFSWTFMVMLPLFIYGITSDKRSTLVLYIIEFFANWYMHVQIDNGKANEGVLNLVEDQALHLVQIIAVWLITCAAMMI